MTSPVHCSYDNSGNLVQQQLNPPPAAPQILGVSGNGTRIVAVGRTVSLAVAVADVDGVTFQWQFKAPHPPGKVNVNVPPQTLTLSNVTAEMEGKYTVTVTNSLGSAAATVSVFVDSTGDLLPDTWQISHNLTGQRAAGDPDQDGIDNLDEFLDGTDPNSSASQRARLIAFSDPGGVVTVDPFKLSYSLGETVTLTATPFANYTFAGWTGDLPSAQFATNPVQLKMAPISNPALQLSPQTASKRVRAKMTHN
jgi:hypothetical protein